MSRKYFYEECTVGIFGARLDSNPPYVFVLLPTAWIASIGGAASVKRRRRASKEKDGLEETQGEERKQGGACKGMEINKG